MYQHLLSRAFDLAASRFSRAFVLAGAMASCGVAAQAGSVSFTDFSVVTIGAHNNASAGGLTTSADITGNAFVSGDVKGLATMAQDLPTVVNPATDPRYALTVAGNLNFSNYANIDDGYSVQYAGSKTSGNFNFNGGGVLTYNSSGNLATEQKSLYSQVTSVSNTFGGMAATPVMTTTDGAGNVTYTYEGPAKGVAVIDIASSVLSTFQRTLNLNMNGASSVVINVTGLPSSGFTVANTFNWGGDFDDANASKIIWNFGTLTGTLETGNRFIGSILAPDANFGNGSYVDGSIFVQSYLNGAGEIHYANGGHVVQYSGFNPLAVPEPPAIILASIGTLGIGFMVVKTAQGESQALLRSRSDLLNEAPSGVANRLDKAGQGRPATSPRHDRHLAFNADSSPRRRQSASTRTSRRTRP